MDVPPDTERSLDERVEHLERRMDDVERVIGTAIRFPNDDWITVAEAVQLTGRSEATLRRRRIVVRGHVLRTTAQQHRKPTL